MAVGNEEDDINTMMTMVVMNAFLLCPSVPSRVEYLEALFRGSSHFLLEWGPPIERNGELTGYQLGYRKSERAVSLILLCLVLSFCFPFSAFVHYAFILYYIIL